MTILTDVRNFFIRERRWGLLFLFLLGVVAFSFFRPGKPGNKPSSSGAVEELQQAEVKLKDEIRLAGGMREFLEKRPGLLMAFNILSLLLVTTIVLGLFLDFSWLMRSEWRSRLRVTESPPSAEHWGLGTIFKVVLLFLSVAFGLGIALSFVKSQFFPWIGTNLLSLIHTTIADLLCVGFIVYFLRLRGGSWRDLGLGKIRVWEDLGIGIAGYAAILPLFFLVLAGVALLAFLFSYEPPPHPLVGIFLEEEKRSPATVAYSIFLACVAGPLLEEIFFRGFCYPAFKKRWGKVWALSLSAAFFALIHENLFAFLPIFVLGLGLGYLYEKRGTLLPSITLHVIHNSVFIAYFFLVKKVLM